MLCQTGRSWVSSPIGSHLLLAMCKNENPQTKKYVQIKEILTKKRQNRTINKIFYSDTIKIDFQETGRSIHEISLGIADSVNFKEFCRSFIKPETKLLLTNISSYENKWQKTYDSGSAIMKIYNSFNYTEDIKYEARLLELPMRDDFKLVIITPNEVDVLCNLINKLTDKGLTAAIASIQPLFTSVSALQAPSIKFSSTPDMIQHYSGNNYCLATAEYGNVKMDEHGVSIKVVTYMFPSNTQPREFPCIENENLKKTFFFGLIFDDTPIFTGQYVDVK